MRNFLKGVCFTWTILVTFVFYEDYVVKSKEKNKPVSYKSSPFTYETLKCNSDEKWRS